MYLIKFIPRKLLSRIVGCFVHIKFPLGVGSLFALVFAKYYDINLFEAEKEWHEYSSIGDLFTRKLKFGVRPISSNAIIHPSDSKITSHGRINKNQLLQAKDISYDLKDFTLDDRANEKWGGGYFVTYYLCPTDYHRVHSPVNGHIMNIKHFVGDLWPVNNWSVENIARLFVINERVNIEIATEWGPVLVSLVGATNVGQISLAFDSEVRTNVAKKKNHEFRQYKSPIEVKKGEELGIFHMGSTVIVLYPARVMDVFPDLYVESKNVKIGEALV